METIENIEVNKQNSIRIAARVGVIYVDPLEIAEECKWYTIFHRKWQLIFHSFQSNIIP